MIIITQDRGHQNHKGFNRNYHRNFNQRPHSSSKSKKYFFYNKSDYIIYNYLYKKGIKIYIKENPIKKSSFPFKNRILFN